MWNINSTNTTLPLKKMILCLRRQKWKLVMIMRGEVNEEMKGNDQTALSMEYESLKQMNLQKAATLTLRRSETDGGSVREGGG